MLTISKYNGKIFIAKGRKIIGSINDDDFSIILTLPNKSSKDIIEKNLEAIKAMSKTGNFLYNIEES